MNISPYAIHAFEITPNLQGLSEKELQETANSGRGPKSRRCFWPAHLRSIMYASDSDCMPGVFIGLDRSPDVYVLQCGIAGADREW